MISAPLGMGFPLSAHVLGNRLVILFGSFFILVWFGLVGLGWVGLVSWQRGPVHAGAHRLKCVHGQTTGAVAAPGPCHGAVGGLNVPAA